MNKAIRWVGAGAGILAFLVCACSTPQKEPQGPVPGVVARVDSAQILETDVEGYLATLPRARRDRLIGEQGRREVVQTLVDRELLASEARLRHLENDPELARQIDDLLIRRLLEIEANRRFSDEVATAIYESHSEQFVSKRYPLRHILFRTRIEDGERAEELARKRAEDALSLIKDGADFGAIAKEKSEDALSVTKGGELGSLSMQSLPPGLAEVVAAMSEGLYPEVVRSSVGYHIVELKGPPIEKRRDLEEVRPLLKTLHEQEVRGQLLDELRHKHEVELY